MTTIIAISPELTSEERYRLATLGRELLAQHNVTPIDKRGASTVVGVAHDIKLAELAAALEAHGLRLARDPDKQCGLRIERAQ